MNPTKLREAILALKEAGTLVECPAALTITPHGIRAFNAAVEAAAQAALAELDKLDPPFRLVICRNCGHPMSEHIHSGECATRGCPCRKGEP